MNACKLIALDAAANAGASMPSPSYPYYYRYL